MALLTMALLTMVLTMALLTYFGTTCYVLLTMALRVTYLLLTTDVALFSLQPTARPTADDRLEFVDPVQSARPG